MQKNNYNILKTLFKPEYIMVWISLGIYLLFAVLLPGFGSYSNLFNILRQGSLNALMIVGVTCVITCGEFDVSFPDIAGLSGIVLAYLTVIRHTPILPAFVAAIAVGVLFGALNGFLVTRFKFSSIIATIAVAGIAKSIAFAISEVRNIPMPMSGHFVDFIAHGRIGPVPMLLIVTIIVYVVVAFVKERMVLGQHIYAVGDNRLMSFQVGLKIKTITFGLFIFSATMAAFTGTITTAFFRSGIPALPASFFLNGLGAIFLGAMMFRLGKPNVKGSFVGAMMLAVISNGLTFIGAPEHMNFIIKGIILVSSVVIITVSRGKKLSAVADRL